MLKKAVIPTFMNKALKRHGAPEAIVTYGLIGHGSGRDFPQPLPNHLN